ncbi:MAG: arylsulfatase [Verrucomicrobiales bacterium]|nr:arylsulfatase [Verrucomicrobiales bacterium]
MTPRPPNFLLILADDLGYSDLGCYGGEIRTPNLDRLASRGLRFSQFYNTARCWPTRAALLTGYYPQQVRMDPPRGRLPSWARLLPHHLKPLGYRTYHSGKWHVMGAPRACADGGFDRSYVLEDHDRNFHPRRATEDDVALPPVDPAGGYYSTTAIADHALRCLRDHAVQHADRPFLTYLAFTVPHFPLQAPPADVARYADRYGDGWDAVADTRWRRLGRLGLAPATRAVRGPWSVPPWNLGTAALVDQIGPGEMGFAPPWETLTGEQRRFQAAKMAVHAAMVDRMDHEIGRVLEQLRQMGVLEDTVVLFASDNGASAELLNRGDRHTHDAVAGSPESFLCLGPGWSGAANTPFSRHKAWVDEGGISTPLIVQWPKGIRERGVIRRQVGHVIDIVPTLVELAGGDPRQVLPADAPVLPGRSLAKAWMGDGPVSRESLFFHHEGHRALRVGDWKIVGRQPRPDQWALYHLAEDRGETRDLAQEQPERVQWMSAEWERLSARFRADAGD